MDMITYLDLRKRYKILMDTLSDPNYDLLTDNYRIIEDVRDLVQDYSAATHTKWNGGGLVSLLLLRVRNKSRHVFAITVGMFPGFEEIENYWNMAGFTDPDGYQWMKPC